MNATQLRYLADVEKGEQLAAQRDAAADVVLRPEDGNASGSSTDFLKSKFHRHVDHHDLPRLFDLVGNPLEADAFPDTGDGLTVDTAMAIATRFRARMLSNRSSGSAMACYIRHILYAIGSKKPSSLQRDLVMTLNTYALRRSTSLRRIVGFVERAIESPDELRIVLTGLLRDQKALLDTVASSTLVSELRGKSVLVIGYSEAIVSLLRSADAQGSAVNVHVLEEPSAEMGAVQAAYVRSLRKTDRIRVVPAGQSSVLEAEIGLVLVATDSLAVGQDRRLHVWLPDDGFGKLLDSAQVKQLVVVSSLAKLNSRPISDNKRKMLVGIDRERIDRIISEVGLLSAAEFVSHPDVETLSGIKSPEAFFSALIIRDSTKRQTYVTRIKDNESGSPPAARDVDMQELSEAELAELEDFLQPDGDVPAYFFKGREECELLNRDEAWVKANEGNYVASVGNGKTIIRDSFWMAVRAAKAEWALPAPYVARVSHDAMLDFE